MNILVGVDLAPATEKIVRSAESLARALKARLWLVHVAEPEPDFVGFDIGPQVERDARSEAFHQEHAEVQAIADGLRQQGLEATALLVQGPTVELLLQEAANLDADMIILGSHGRGAVQRLLVGSVSEGVLHRAACPVLIVPTHERKA